MSNALRLAIRDLRAGGHGLWLLLVCLFLGTAALAGIGSLSASITGALDDQSRQLLGGDLELRVSQRRATVERRREYHAIVDRMMAAGVGHLLPSSEELTREGNTDTYESVARAWAARQDAEPDGAGAP